MLKYFQVENDVMSFMELRERRWAVGQIQYGSYMNGNWNQWLSQDFLIWDPVEEDQAGPCEQLDTLSPFNPLNEMRQKEKEYPLHPIGTTRSPRGREIK